MKITKQIADKVLKVVDAGLVSGLGSPEPGKMCVEAAVCFALGLPHGDDPKCVGESVRRFKIRLNDAKWSSDEARAHGLRKLAVAQLGSDAIDQAEFRKLLAEGTIRRIVAVALRAAAKLNPKHADALEAAAVRCEVEGTREAAKNARAASAYASADASDAAAASASASASASADAAASAYAYAAYASADAADAAAYASADDAASAVGGGARDAVLNISSDVALQALIKLKSPGCAFLYLTEAK